MSATPAPAPSPLSEERLREILAGPRHVVALNDMLFGAEVHSMARELLALRRQLQHVTDEALRQRPADRVAAQDRMLANWCLALEKWRVDRVGPIPSDADYQAFIAACRAAREAEKETPMSKVIGAMPEITDEDVTALNEKPPCTDPAHVAASGALLDELSTLNRAARMLHGFVNVPGREIGAHDCVRAIIAAARACEPQPASSASVHSTEDVRSPAGLADGVTPSTDASTSQPVSLADCALLCLRSMTAEHGNLWSPSGDPGHVRNLRMFAARAAPAEGGEEQMTDISSDLWELLRRDGQPDSIRANKIVKTIEALIDERIRRASEGRPW